MRIFQSSIIAALCSLAAAQEELPPAQSQTDLITADWIYSTEDANSKFKAVSDSNIRQPLAMDLKWNTYTETDGSGVTYFVTELAATWEVEWTNKNSNRNPDYAALAWTMNDASAMTLMMDDGGLEFEEGSTWEVFIQGATSSTNAKELTFLPLESGTSSMEGGFSSFDHSKQGIEVLGDTLLPTLQAPTPWEVVDTQSTTGSKGNTVYFTGMKVRARRDIADAVALMLVPEQRIAMCADLWLSQDEKDMVRNLLGCTDFQLNLPLPPKPPKPVPPTPTESGASQLALGVMAAAIALASSAF